MRWIASTRSSSVGNSRCLPRRTAPVERVAAEPVERRRRGLDDGEVRGRHVAHGRARDEGIERFDERLELGQLGHTAIVRGPWRAGVVEEVRGGVVEARHRVHAVVVEGEGAVLAVARRCRDPVHAAQRGQAAAGAAGRARRRDRALRPRGAPRRRRLRLARGHAGPRGDRRRGRCARRLAARGAAPARRAPSASRPSRRASWRSPVACRRCWSTTARATMR